MCNHHACAGWLAALLFAVSTASSGTAGEIIGLCYREGSHDAVLEEVFRTEGVSFVRLRDLGRLEQLDLKELVLMQRVTIAS